MVRNFVLLLAAAGLLVLGAADTCPGLDPGQGVTQSERPSLPEPSIFTELNGEELARVRDFLQADPDLNLVNADEAAPNANYIYVIEMLAPPKAEALAYLDKEGPRPARRAYAVLILMNATRPRIMQVEVGDLYTDTLSWKEYMSSKQAHPISYHSRPGSGPEYNRVDELAVEAAAVLEPMMSTVLGGYTYNDECEKCLWWTDSAPRGIYNKQRKYWVWWMRLVDGTYLHPVGLDFYINTTGTDPAEWHISSIQFANRYWKTAEALAAAFAKTPGKAVEVPAARDPETTAWQFLGVTYFTPGPTDIRYSTFNVRNTSDVRPSNLRHGPVQYEPQGKRYSITGHHVSWMGWEFDVGVRSTGGMRTWDMRFKGERIVYEMALQAAYAAYGGAQATQSLTMYLDNSWGLGSAHHELVHGMDCPLHAQYFDFWHHWDGNEAYKLPNSMCVFEMNQALPLRRHYDKDFEGSYRFYAGAPTHTLIVRAMSTVFNYDYIYDLILYADGTVEYKIGAYGYPQAAKYDRTADAKYGYKMYYDLGGTIHDHMFHIKVDPDVLGTANTLEIDEFKVEKWKPAYDPELPASNKLQVQRRVVENENGARFLMSPTKPMVFYLTSNETNRWGSKRGYRVQIDKIVHNILPANTPWMKGAAWTRHNLVATVQKDEELTSATIFEQASPANPTIDFAKYTDGESLRGQDLVLWLTLGTHHIPLSEDAPNTPSSGTFSTFLLKPHNYFDADPATDLAETLVIHKSEDGETSVYSDYGVPPIGDCVPEFPSIRFNGTYAG